MHTDDIRAFGNLLTQRGYITSNMELVAALHFLRDDMANMGGRFIPALLLDGPPGTGKTFGAEIFAQIIDAPLHMLQFTPGLGREALMADVNVAAVVAAQARGDRDVQPRDLLLPGFLQRALEMSHEGNVVVLLDELDKAKPAVDAFLLDFLNTARLSEPAFGVIEGNPRQMAVFVTKNNMRSLTEPLMRRMRRVTIGWPEPQTEVRMVKRMALGLLNGRRVHGNVDALCTALVELANNVRRHEARLRKVPSAPELARAVADSLRTQDRSYWPAIWRGWLLAYPEDTGVLGDTLADSRLSPYIRTV